MRFIFRVRHVSYFFVKNWWGLRKGPIWSVNPKERTVYLLDLGAVTIGVAK